MRCGWQERHAVGGIRVQCKTGRQVVFFAIGEEEKGILPLLDGELLLEQSGGDGRGGEGVVEDRRHFYRLIVDRCDRLRSDVMRR